jgi:hypothetical protein
MTGLLYLRFLVAAFVAGVAAAWPAMVVAPFPFAAPFILAASLAASFLVGLPTALVMRGLNRFSWKSAVITGAILAQIPFGLAALLWIFAGGIFLILALAVAGAIGGLVFCGSVSLQGGAYHKAAGPLVRVRQHAVSLVLGAAALLAANGLVSLPEPPPDLTCHNIFRNGQVSAPLIGARLAVTQADWPRARSIVEAFAVGRGWSLRDTSENTEGRETLVLSLCEDAGTQIQVSRWIGDPGADGLSDALHVQIARPQGGEGWVEPSRALIRALEAEWPGKMSYGLQNGGWTAIEPTWMKSPEAEP